MSGSPKTMKRLPEPVFLRSSSPIARSVFIEGEAAHDEEIGEVDSLACCPVHELSIDCAVLMANGDCSEFLDAVLFVLGHR